MSDKSHLAQRLSAFVYKVCCGRLAGSERNQVFVGLPLQDVIKNRISVVVKLICILLSESA